MYEQQLDNLLSKIFLLDSDSMSTLFRQTFVPSFIYDYYQNRKNNSTFEQYISSITLDYLKKKFSIPYLMFSSILDQVKADTTLLGIPSNSTPLGDLHYKGGTKYLYENSIKYNLFPDYNDYIENLLKILGLEPIHYIPKVSRESSKLNREFIDIDLNTSNPKVIKEYYYNLGKIIPILLLIRATDVYSENMLIKLPYPVFFDLESIFTGELERGYTILETGLVKVLNEYDVSVLSGGEKLINSYLLPLIEGDANSPTIKWKYLSRLQTYNIPSIKHKNVEAKNYLDSITKGYTYMQNIIHDKKNEIEDITQEQKCYVRHIARPTSFYRSRIQQFLFPNIYRTEDSEHFFAKQLENKDTIYKINDIESLNKYEIKALSQSLIPVYYQEIHTNKIVSPQGEIITTTEHSPINIWMKHMSEIDSFLVQQKQVLIDSLQ